MTDREAWLLSDVSSVGRTTIDVGQYEELRALAIAMRERIAFLELDRVAFGEKFARVKDMLRAEQRRISSLRQMGEAASEWLQLHLSDHVDEENEEP